MAKERSEVVVAVAVLGLVDLDGGRMFEVVEGCWKRRFSKEFIRSVTIKLKK